MRKRMAMLLVLCMVSGIVYPAGSNETYAAEMQETEIISENVSSLNEELETTNIEADENGFIIKEGVLTGYVGEEEEIIIPSGVESIGWNAFSGCSNLTKVELPDSVRVIGYGAFADCSNLEKIELPDSLSQIMGSAFSGCSSLTKVELPNSLSQIMDSAFSGCSSLTEIEIPLSVRRIESGAFSGCSSLESVELMNISNIGSGAFSNCVNLKEVRLPKSMKRWYDEAAEPPSIEERAFLNCISLKSIEIPNGIGAIKTGTFQGCSSLESVKMSSSITSIEPAAFYECISLNDVAISDGVNMIGANAFSNCSNLARIGMPNSVISIAGNAFDGCSPEFCIYSPVDSYAETYAKENSIIYKERKNQMITASDFTKTAGDEPFSIEAVTDGEGALTYESSDEEVVSVSENGIATIHGMGKSTITITACGTAEWKEEQKSIDILVYSNSEDEFCIGSGYYMNYDSEELVKREGVLYAYRGDAEEVTIPDNVYIIEDGVFSGCDTVTSINIHKDVDIISAAAFDNCRNLKAINVEEVDEDYEEDVIYRSIDGVLYSNGSCIRCPEGKSGSVDLHNKVSKKGTIKSGAFLNCRKLTSVKLLYFFGNIADDAFEGCSEDFYIECFKGSYTETYAIEKGIKYVSRKQTQQLYVYETDISVTIGEEPYILDVDLEEGDGALTYASSDETVVTVSETGVLAFVGVGTAEITITASETDEWSETKEVINITVNDTQNEGQKPNEGQTPGGEQEPNEGQTPGGEQEPSEGQTPDEEQNPNEEPDTTQELETEKEEQTITAKNMKKTYSTKSFSLGAKTDGGGELTYSVENKKIAKVDKNGKVTIKGCGVTKVVIKAAENEDYNAATKTITLTVVPKKATLTSVKSTKTKTITVKWKKDTKASGYIIEYSTDKKFKKNVGKVTVSKNKTTSKKISKLKAGKKYYVRVCAYTVSKGNKIKGAYTKAKMVKVKK